MTKKEAYAIAMTRFNVHTEAQRQENDGITWQAIGGEVKYAEWSELPESTRQYE